MRQSVELRVQERFAKQYLRDDEGEPMGSPEERRLFGVSVRKLVLDVTDPRYQEVGEITRRLYAEQDEYFYHGWDIHRTYSRKELESAELLELIPLSMFEPSGIACGTQYDYARCCPLCGAGRAQTSDLILDLRKAPRTRDIAVTIGNEWIVSQRLAQLLVDNHITGMYLGPVRHKARYQDDSYTMSEYLSGREIIQKAASAGLNPVGWEFSVWLNRPEQADLKERFINERIERGAKRAINTIPLPTWHQLLIPSDPLQINPRTRFGIEPFIEDPEEDNRCPLGHVLGLSVLSELYVEQDSWDGSDINVTQQLVGIRRGALVPRPFVLVSQRLYRILKEHKVRGYKVEVVHLV